ncbi:SURF1 family protein [Janthinobacterium agaricidamnosum]|uniref:SURF1-like protein n=1 Tax=Janthinobacterium agaricidamnosum NBRC 102515 = DSM 9628 TaxID=1349767 RepID=W0VBX3_9BURK|nr:SURF1 family protein [Janthinobacterium agaricidamnosum]CDG85130.1 transmembrane cytochrome oxidase complex biogenesis factor transmembrane protein [Janthinobacterium agaricidamnosum NBRC 102515 = DSM 9628]
MRIRFRFRWIPLIATLLLVILGVSLGQWQDRRAAQKLALEAKLNAGHAAAPLQVGATRLAPEAVEFRKVTVTGEFVPDWVLYLDNRPYQGRAGFYVLMPFKISGSSMHVLVERGWLPRNTQDRLHLPDYSTPSGTVTIEGVARLNAGHVMQLGSTPPLTPKAIVQNADVGQVSTASGLALQPFIIEQTGAVPAGELLVRDWPAPSLGVEKHRGYAFQWYALAVMAFLFFVLTGFRRGTQ